MFEFNATLIVAIVSFVVFMIIMNNIFYRPILNIIKKREQYVDSNYSEADNNIKKSQELQAKRESAISNKKLECRQKIESTIDQAQKISIQKTNEQREINKQEIQSKKEILYKEKQNLQLDINNNVVKDLADTISNKIIKI